ncbi:ABC transporter ATP-binding protein [Pseudomonas graminis]|uniref:Hemin import ATP-binding protein HmuV n=1 Tax=Pseudomonas graminis TaxID=158627 RepID=A0A6M8MYI5_9PSED|nr:ABC transporter ATP-binding protein [Pseudomonas graminis]QKF53505.1 Hemin import ATP-binding protein HmuV [Pseudomonas graminis]
MKRLQARQLSYRVGDRVILDNICLDIKAGDNIALLGANGAGKSTLMKLLLGLLAPHTGEVLINGQPMRAMKRRAVARQIAYVPQSHVPSFPFRVAHIVGQGRLPTVGLGHGPSRDDKASVQQALTDLGILQMSERPYTELSGGERQLVLIARAMVQRANIIVLDEPVTGLDYGHQLRLLALLKRLAAQGISILSSTHRPEHALASANRVLVLHEGRLIADGAPHDVIDSALMARLYQVAVEQIDTGGHRFFIPC